MRNQEFAATVERNVGGFTLIEVMIVVAIVAVLAAIAIPNYADYIKRGKITEATTALSDIRTRYEQYFLDNRKYSGGCALFSAAVQDIAKAFTLNCATETDTTYAPTMTGIPGQGMDAAFVYTINQLNQKTSDGPGGTYHSTTCWAIRKDGSCS